MKKLSLPFIVNSVLSFAIVFPLLTLVFGANGLKVGAAASFALTLAVTASLSLGVLLTALSKGKSPLNAHNPRMLILNACTDDEIREYFFVYFRQKHKCAYATDKHLFVVDEKRDEPAGMEISRDFDEEFYLAFYPEEVRANDLATIERFTYDSAAQGKLSVVSMEFSAGAIKYAERRKIKLVDEKQILEMLDEYDLLKNIEKKQSFVLKLKGLFNPIFGKKAIFYGLFIAVLSPIAAYGIYYAVFGGLLFFYGIAAVTYDKVISKKKKSVD